MVQCKHEKKVGGVIYYCILEKGRPHLGKDHEYDES